MDPNLKAMWSFDAVFLNTAHPFSYIFCCCFVSSPCQFLSHSSEHYLLTFFLFAPSLSLFSSHPPCGSPSCSLHLDLLFLFPSNLLSFLTSNCHPNFLPVSSLGFHPCLTSLRPSSPSVFCVSRTHMVTQIY